MRERLLAGALVVPFAVGTLSAPEHPGETAFGFTDPAIVESSGLAVADGLVVTTNDSGDTGRVFTVDPRTGDTVGVTHWSEDGGEPVDVEALAPAGPHAVWVGDIGDNTASRSSVTVARVPVGRGDRSVTPPTYDLVYPDGPVNAESLLANPTTGRLYLASKLVFGGRLYAAPARLDPDRPNRLRELGPVLPIATDGAFLPGGRHLVLRDYGSAVVYTFPGLEVVDRFRLPDQDQGEGLVPDPERPAGALLLSSEGQREPVLRVRLPAVVRRALAAGTPGSGRPEPATGAARPSGEPAEERGVETWAWLATGGVVVAGLALAAGLLLGRRVRH